MNVEDSYHADNNKGFFIHTQRTKSNNNGLDVMTLDKMWQSKLIATDAVNDHLFALP